MTHSDQGILGRSPSASLPWGRILSSAFQNSEAALIYYKLMT